MENERKTILAVDDDITILTTIRRILEKQYDVCLAKSAEIASTILKTTGVDMILLDMEMPGVSGMEFLKYLMSTPPYDTLPVIIVSSNAVADIILQATKLGARDFIVKPISPNILTAKINAFFAPEPEASGKDLLLQNLNKLYSACIQGKTNVVEDLINELKKTAPRTGLEKLYKYLAQFDYNLAAEEVKNLLDPQNFQ